MTAISSRCTLHHGVALAVRDASQEYQRLSAAFHTLEEQGLAMSSAVQQLNSSDISDSECKDLYTNLQSFYKSLNSGSPLIRDIRKIESSLFRLAEDLGVCTSVNGREHAKAPALRQQTDRLAQLHESAKKLYLSADGLLYEVEEEMKIRSLPTAEETEEGQEPRHWGFSVTDEINSTNTLFSITCEEFLTDIQKLKWQISALRTDARDWGQKGEEERSQLIALTTDSLCHFQESRKSIQEAATSLEASTDAINRYLSEYYFVPDNIHPPYFAMALQNRREIENEFNRTSSELIECLDQAEVVCKQILALK